MKPGKTQEILLNLPRERADEIGRQVEVHLRTDMAYIVNRYVKSYRTAVSNTFGWTEEDLVQQVRIVFWKGLATYKPEKQFKITTYLSAILHNYFNSLYKKCRSLRNSRTKLLCVENIYETDASVTLEGADDWYDYARSFNYFMDKLSEIETTILNLKLTRGDSIAAISEKLEMPKHQVVAIEKAIKSKISQHLKEIEDEEDSTNYEPIQSSTERPKEQFEDTD